jgi:hypothetical protein
VTDDTEIRAFLEGVQEADEEDLLRLIKGWEARPHDPVHDLVVAVHEDLLDMEANDRLLEPDERYYSDAVNRYAVDQDTASLEDAARLLEQNIDESYLEDLYKLCAAVIRERVPAAVIPDDEP